MNNLNLKVQKIHSNAILPNYAHCGDAGMDFFSIENAIINPGERKGIATGIKMAIPKGFVGLIWDKSGRALNDGLKTMAGVIDSGYRGEVIIVLLNTSNKKMEIKIGFKIAQMLIQKVEQPEIKETNILDKTSRGYSGFGSTGE
ncbi:MAG: Deoxyuridine 5'-triphosphate nucleotidohydrolase [Candidatus Roizmanbacteria bacterium GW2011_GWA2_32_13]|uniref:dUTP diphosphatase n=1 Tax=Candidatus Roizmanbacteria bacterium GW2011_GWA2_32_13 TaxID=1618475 RepID=A0A0F9YPS3_9BACT|nr:MAG: Deoxyuridine 5'-triphosphate nucleotidohydrolase [Candidatus Roizmanbacteria bacterium GW2011_GWA2_32_13]